MYGGMIVSAIPFQIEGEYRTRYIREKGGLGGINLATPELDKLYCGNSSVTDSTKAILIINFPSKKIIGYEITSENGFSKKDIIVELSKAYAEIYKNKKKYEICCDKLSDLELKSIVVFKVGQRIYLESEVSSKK
ncbi:hypothetical protein [Kordia sp.]|uniref:hypothetical protein n=1 Tax=Kordia sp. TaxID=1965332 RepID=UPI0025C6D45A|nr:hypothetical protein [Kordia sp.]MCH2194463.1 hypothetical protein [Kordia sp.]